MKKYDLIIGLPHHVSSSRPRMTMEARAAQFAPFAALNGHSEALDETARLTSEPIELSDGERYELSKRIAHLGSIAAPHRPKVTVTYFESDENKPGGRYKNHTGVLKRVDTHNRNLIFQDGTSVMMETLVNIIPESDSY